ncbi:carbamoyl-phosphate synthase large subunit [Tindallia californiensis]|uniref:Carbamoyl phosphate synthase large chain n=1 Tax=Tindallia californiensis TaxID=159292 RepID=A0A1H3L404_9FIRM|nr:carbamoyl-phosphate synthase large subunit [Tindallia californiensis]SDY59090.1 carbamoyl-phosphate synthase large subunit [Tindallia californiensis]
MPLNKELKKIMILGSGPIMIGQAAEFDYSGTQACKAIKEEGIETILVNSNPATIMTDVDLADKVYLEPMTKESILQILNKEAPDGILAGFGGQTALNIAMELQNDGILQSMGVKLLGVESETIKKAEDREAFKQLLEEIDEPMALSVIATGLDECKTFIEEAGYPVIIRPAYTLGGYGGGIATDDESLMEIAERGMKASPIGQILLEQSVAGWKEIEYEVIRDHQDNCMIVCNMENMDPVGVHTGDSIVIAPSQTLRDREYQMLRKASIKIIRSLKVSGGCNIQFAVNPNSCEYVVIEVNPRVSRSSALASKAVGYPIAKIAAKIAVGYHLNELKNAVTKKSSAFFEPVLDYVVVKFPKWPFEKFKNVNRTLGTQMKATGEVMAIARSFEAALLKAITSLDGNFTGLRLAQMSHLAESELDRKIDACDDERIFALADAVRRGYTLEKLFRMTQIDLWFLQGIKNIIDMEKRLKDEKMNEALLYAAESMGFIDEEILDLSGTKASELRKLRKDHAIFPVYKMVDTCGGEFEAATPYYYSCYEEENENRISHHKKVLVIGSGPIRIGQGIEFDYGCVHGAWAIKEAGYESIMMNNNPETVSTDFDTSDKLYFETLHIDDVMNVVREEKPEGVILQLGGQTSVNLAPELYARGVNILGTSFSSMDLAEDRMKCNEFLLKHNIGTPKGMSADSEEDAIRKAETLGYPVIVRPSYVIGGRGMQIIGDENEMREYLEEMQRLFMKYPLFVDQYISGVEIEVDAVADGENLLIPGIMEHIEKTGVHSGDSISVYPAEKTSKMILEKIEKTTKVIVQKLAITGLVNIQYVIKEEDVFVIEINPRASRTVPILSKITDVPMVKLAVRAMLGESLTEMGYGTGILPSRPYYAVKVPVFSAEKISDADMALGPEMKSTGEVLGIDEDYVKALMKGFIASGIHLPETGGIYFSLKDEDKEAGLKLASDYTRLGFRCYSANGTSKFLKENGVRCQEIEKESLLKEIRDKRINIIVNTPSGSRKTNSQGHQLRKMGILYKLPTFTTLETAEAFLRVMERKQVGIQLSYRSLREYLNM